MIDMLADGLKTMKCSEFNKCRVEIHNESLCGRQDFDIGPDELPSLFEHCSWRASCAGDILDNKMKEKRRIRDRNVDLISSPFIYCMSQRFFKIILICISIFISGSCFYAVSVLLNGIYPKIQVNSAKIVWSKETPTIESAKINFSSDCDDEQHNSHGIFNNSSHLGRPVLIYGFTLTINGTGDCQSNSYHFTLHGSNDDGNTFISFGSSRIRWTLQGLRFVDQGFIGCSKNISVDFQPPSPWFAAEESAAFPLISGASLSAAAVCAVLHQHRAAKNVITGSLLAMALFMLLSCIGFLSLGFYAEAFHPGACFCGFFALAYALVYSERHFVEYLATVGAIFLAARVLNDTMYPDWYILQT